MADPHWEIYDDAAGKPRWRLRARNGLIVASSGESFSSKYATRIAILVAQHCAQSTIVEDEASGT